MGVNTLVFDAPQKYYPECEWTLYRACNDVINFMRLQGMHPRSSRWITTHKRQLVNIIDSRLIDLCGKAAGNWKERLSDSEVALAFDLCGKKGYVAMRDGKNIPSDCLPLWESECEGAIVYAYIGVTAEHPEGLIKIGWTGQDLTSYLAQRRIAHKPILLASTPGDQDTEKKLHAKCRQYLAEGREWFLNCSEVIDVIKSSFVFHEDRLKSM